MKILFVAGECDPFIKTGGLGDVVGSLPRYLTKLEEEVSVVIPKYSQIDKEELNKFKFLKAFNVPMSWRNQYCGVFTHKEGGVTYYLLDNEYYFKREGLYGFGDDDERFSFFNRAVLMMLWELDYKPDIIHCHDWHSAMIPVIYKEDYKDQNFYKGISIVYTIHNLKFQGIFRKEVLGDYLNLSERLFEDGTLSFYDSINFMQGALKASDKITTVSKTYSEEIKTSFYGEQMDGILNKRHQDLVGILNGIDYKLYDPAKDKYLDYKYSCFRLGNKTLNKLALQREVGLPEDETVPLMSIVSRLTPQKGMDILLESLDKILEENIQLIVLGTGDKYYEHYFMNLCEKYPSKVTAVIAFNNELAHKIYGGADMFLMPSLFEPCGLGQLIALRYGTIPIVRATGGLIDTIEPFKEESSCGNGFVFSSFTSSDLYKSMKEALLCFSHKDQWNTLMINAMESDNSWEKSALKYKELYERVVVYCNEVH